MTRRKLILRAFQAFDLLVLIISTYITVGLSAGSSTSIINQYMMDGHADVYAIIIMAVMFAVWLTLFYSCGLYKQRYLTFTSLRRYHLSDLVTAVSLGTLIFIGILFLAGVKEISSTFLFAFWAANIIGTLAVREVLIFTLKRLRLHGRNLRHLLIIGTNKRALAFADRVKNQPELGYTLRGFVDDEWQNFSSANNPEHHIVAKLDQIDEYLRDNVVDEVVIALPIATLYEKASRIVKLCNDQGIVVHFAPGFDFLNVGSSMMNINISHGEPIITIVPPPISGWKMGLKRAIDTVCSAILIVVFSPVLLGIIIAIKLYSPGPVFFIQERVGLNKRKFRLLKFRTMVINAEEIQKQYEHLNEAGGPVFKIENDPRITPIGHFLRRSSLDELPQLFNVLFGDMSLVGPRPLPLRDYEGFDQVWHRRRFSVRPGITCLWQISGRSSITFDRWMELDMEYINHWSLWLDIKILLATIPAVLKQRGAV